MEKINLHEFNQNMTIVIRYAMRHLLKEDWEELDGGLMITDVFDTMQYYVLATQKCQEYLDILEEYEEADRKTRGCVFLDA